MALNDVSLTCVPASQANSAETTGLRIDGRDSCTQEIPASRLKAKEGRIRWRWTPRRDAADFWKFGQSNPFVMAAWGNGNYYISVRSNAANNLRLRLRLAGVSTDYTWNCTGAIVAGTTYQMEIRYSSGTALLLVDGIVVLTCAPAAGIDFATVPTTFYAGRNPSGAETLGATFAIP